MSEKSKADLVAEVQLKAEELEAAAKLVDEANAAVQKHRDALAKAYPLVQEVSREALVSEHIRRAADQWLADVKAAFGVGG